MYETTEIASLIRKKLEGTLSVKERIMLDRWAKESAPNSELLKRISDENLLFEDVVRWLEVMNEDEEGGWIKSLEKRTFKKIHTHIQNQTKVDNKKPVYMKLWPYVAAILFCAGITLVLYNSKVPADKKIVVSDLNPGGNRAYMTLSDGSVIELSEDKDGIVLGEELTYSDGSLISRLNESEVVYAELKTPRGGQYQVTLSDGTKVWLNADSKLKYPSRFEKNVREVELEGEAYFEVTNITVGNIKQRFVVKTDHQELEVLGTSFNISAYADDMVEATTLVEGAVKLYSGGSDIILSPGEQGVVSGSRLVKRQVEVEQYLAWKNNEFYFNETELEDALKMISRWYDFELIYEGILPKTHFYGSISREKGLSEVLKIMESSGLKFRIEKSGDKNKLIVLK